MHPINNELLKWNPFEDPTPFNQMTEDHIYEAEFDALRDRPSGLFYIIFTVVITHLNLNPHGFHVIYSSKDQ